MGENHIEPLVTVVSPADQNESPRASDVPPATDSLGRTLGEMNDKIGNMADLIGRLCQSLDDRERQATGQTNNPPGKNGGKARASTERRRRASSVVFPSGSEESDDDEMSLCASEDDLERLVGGRGEDPHKDKTTPEGSNTNTSASLLNELEAAINDDENLGPKITQDLADIALKRWGKKIPQEKLKAIHSRHEVPENCAQIEVPRVNGEMWSQLNTHRRTSDLRLSNMQKNLLRATSAVLSMCDKVLTLGSPKDEQKQIMADGVDTIGLLSHVFSDLSGLRKEQMKPALKSEFHSLCSKEIEGPSSLLFGDDLAKQIRDTKEATRIGLVVSHTKHDRQRGQKRQHSDHYRSPNSYKRSFLSKGNKNTGYRKKQRNTRKTDETK